MTWLYISLMQSFIHYHRHLYLTLVNKTFHSCEICAPFLKPFSSPVHPLTHLISPVHKIFQYFSYRVNIVSRVQQCDWSLGISIVRGSLHVLDEPCILQQYLSPNNPSVCLLSAASNARSLCRHPQKTSSPSVPHSTRSRHPSKSSPAPHPNPNIILRTDFVLPRNKASRFPNLK